MVRTEPFPVVATDPAGIAQRRVLRTELPGPRSRELAARRAAAVAPGVSSTLPVYIDAAAGAIVVDVDGNSLIDLGSGIAVTSVGHAVPAVVDAVRDQVGRFTHTCFIGSQGRGTLASPVPHPPFNPYVRFSRIRLTDDLLDMVTLPSGIG